MFGFLKKIFGTASERQIKALMPLLEQVNELYEKYASLSDEELKQLTVDFRRRIIEKTLEHHLELDAIDKEIAAAMDADEIEDLREQRQELDKQLYEAEQNILNEILPEAFAAVKETCRRLVGTEIDLLGHKIVWDMIPFDVQIIGAIILHQGKIAEMATGEGKTLVATMPLYLNALALNHEWVMVAYSRWGKNFDAWEFKPFINDIGEPIPVGRGVHLVTVNDYLARRDATWMGKIYEFLGLSVGVISEDIEPYTPRRKAQYLVDITYGTNNAFGFDYLRDNMATFPEGVVQREHFYAIVDEVDSVLIDEARTPLIISGPVESNISEQFKKWNAPVANLVRQQMRQSARLLSEAQQLWDKALQLREEGKSGDADKIVRDAAIKLVMVKRSTPKNTQFMKLIKEPDILKEMTRVELEYMRDKRLHEIDEELYFAVDEHENSINLMEKGRIELAKFSGSKPEIFVLPDLASELSQIEGKKFPRNKSKR